jgi:hypothetical protein
VKYGFRIQHCPSGRKGLYCIDPSKVVDGKLTVTVDVKFDARDPDGEPRGCAAGMGYSLTSPIAAFMEVHEKGGLCVDCEDKEESGTAPRTRYPVHSRATTRSYRRALGNNYLTKRKVLGDITRTSN